MVRRRVCAVSNPETTVPNSILRDARKSALRMRTAEVLQMREIVRQRLDFLIAEGIGDISHRRTGAAGSDA
jgi:hypothetical protein